MAVAIGANDGSGRLAAGGAGALESVPVERHGDGGVEVVPHKHHQRVIKDTGRGRVGRVVRRGVSHGDVLRIVTVGEHTSVGEREARLA